MISQRQYRFVLLIVIFFLFSHHQCLLAKSMGKDNSFPVNVSIFSNEEKKSSSQTEVAEYLRDAIKQSAYVSLSDKARFEFIVKVQDIPQRKEVIIALLTTQPIPQEVVKLASENEMFYKTAAAKKELPSEGKFIREYVTSEWMSDFSLSVNFEIFRIPENEIKLTCEKIIENFVSRYKIDKNSGKQ